MLKMKKAIIGMHKMAAGFHERCEPLRVFHHREHPAKAEFTDRC
jgi:hypothetical protein